VELRKKHFPAPPSGLGPEPVKVRVVVQHLGAAFLPQQGQQLEGAVHYPQRGTAGSCSVTAVPRCSSDSISKRPPCS
jgi:hypothetical protein